MTAKCCLKQYLKQKYALSKHRYITLPFPFNNLLCLHSLSSRMLPENSTRYTKQKLSSFSSAASAWRTPVTIFFSGENVTFPLQLFQRCGELWFILNFWCGPMNTLSHKPICLLSVNQSANHSQTTSLGEGKSLLQTVLLMYNQCGRISYHHATAMTILVNSHSWSQFGLKEPLVPLVTSSRRKRRKILS